MSNEAAMWLKRHLDFYISHGNEVVKIEHYPSEPTRPTYYLVTILYHGARREYFWDLKNPEEFGWCSMRKTIRVVHGYYKVTRSVEFYNKLGRCPYCGMWEEQWIDYLKDST